MRQRHPVLRQHRRGLIELDTVRLAELRPADLSAGRVPPAAAEPVRPQGSAPRADPVAPAVPVTASMPVAVRRSFPHQTRA